MEQLLFRASGGMGKQINATRVVKQLKFKYPDSVIHVQTSYPEVFANLPFVDKFFQLAPVPYFYDEHKNFKVIEAEPYLNLDYRQGKKHIVDVWCEMLGLDIPKEKTGIIVLDEQEKKIADNIFMNLKLSIPLVAVQFTGGTSYYSPQDANDPSRMKHYRDVPFDIAQEIVNGIVQKKKAVIQIALPTEKRLQNCLYLPDNQVMSPRTIFSILDRCAGGIFIDSFCQHAWTALGKKNAVVLWGGTNPINLGYEQNTNLFNKESCENLHCNRPNTFMFDFIGNNQYWKCPFNAVCMKFKPDNVINQFMNIVEPKAIEPEVIQPIKTN